MKPLTVLSLVLGSGLLGFGLARLADVDGDAGLPPELAQVRSERDAALARAERAEAALAAARQERAAVGRPSAGTSGTEAGEQPAAGPVPASSPTTAAPGAAERAQDARELVAGIEPAFETGDGERALEILRRLASIVPEGREESMKLAARINDDVRGAGTLRLDQPTFYQSLGDTGVLDLMLWSLDNPSPPEFRVLSAWSIPWVIPKERAIEIFGKALAHEKDTMVQTSLVVNLAQMNDERAVRLLASILTDTAREPAMRAQVAIQVASSSDADLARALETAARSDPDERVRSAARAALVARNPPQDGLLVTYVVESGAAATAGVQAGDILVRYDGKVTRELADLRDAINAGGSGQTATIVVLREGTETTLEVLRGLMGVQGRPVRRKS